MVRDINEAMYRYGITTTPPRIDKWLTREEAVAWVKVWGEQNIPKHNLRFPNSFLDHTITSAIENVYLTGLVNELIERIRTGNDDPVTEVAKYYYEMDEILINSDDSQFTVHFFASYMESAAYDVLIFLKDKEKELNRK